MRIAITIGACVVVFGLLAERATAGTYDVWGCRMPDGSPAPIAGWRAVAVKAPPPTTDCATYGGMRAEFPATALAAESSTGWWFEAPANTAIAGYELFRRAGVGRGTDGSGRAYGLFHDEPRLDVNVFLFEYCTHIAQCAQVGDLQAVDPLDPDNRVERHGLRVKRLILRMECGSLREPRTCGPSDTGGKLLIARARISLADDASPTLVPRIGALTTPGSVLEGPQAVTATATDQGGGIRRFVVIVDGVAVHEQPVDEAGRCHAPYVDVVPCPLSVTQNFAFDSTVVPNGPHAVSVGVEDAGGNRTTTPPVRVIVANGASPNGATASRRATLKAGFRLPRRARRPMSTTVRYGRSRPIGGRLVDALGRPIRAAVLAVIATDRRLGAREKREGVVKTDAKGAFRYVPPLGPSRRLRFEYRAFSLDPEPSATAAVTLNVRAGVRLAVRPRRTTSRGTIRFSGKLLGGPGRAGLQVTLYAVGRRGRGRVPVEVLRTNTNGTFRFRYRFARTFAPFTYRFQARIEKQRSYPYAAASSPRATVHVVR